MIDRSTTNICTDSEINIPNLCNDQSSNKNFNSIPCPYCKKIYKGKHGIDIHISKSHPAEFQKIVVNRQSSWTPQTSQNITSTSVPIDVTNGVSSTDGDLRTYKSYSAMEK